MVVNVGADQVLAAHDAQQAPLAVAWAGGSWKSGQMVLTLADGGTARVYRNGLLLVSSPGGTGPEGLATVYGPEGTVTTFGATGDPASVDSLGNPVPATRNGDGSVTVSHQGFALTVWGPGEWRLEAPSGTAWSHDLAGTWTWTLSTGEEFRTGAAGVEVPSGWSNDNPVDGPLADGTVVVSRENGDVYRSRTHVALRPDLAVESFYPEAGLRSVLYLRARVEGGHA